MELTGVVLMKKHSKICNLIDILVNFHAIVLVAR